VLFSARMKAQRLLAFPLVLVGLSISAQPATVPKGANPSNPELQAGTAVYAQHCAACHGAKGDGSGPASVWLFPRPRNFSAGLFKIKSTPGAALPTDEDLLGTATRGMAGSSMPSFTYLTEGERRSAVQYV
jgi:mono/diheme cytochrome c family protein